MLQHKTLQHTSWTTLSECCTAWHAAAAASLLCPEESPHTREGLPVAQRCLRGHCVHVTACFAASFCVGGGSLPPRKGKCTVAACHKHHCRHLRS